MFTVVNEFEEGSTKVLVVQAYSYIPVGTRIEFVSQNTGSRGLIEAW